MHLRHICVFVCKCVFMAVWCALAGVRCVFVALVFTGHLFVALMVYVRVQVGTGGAVLVVCAVDV